MAEPSAYLLVALSARALATAARRSGRRAVVADLFGDTDTRSAAVASAVVAGNFEQGFDEAALMATAERLAPAAQPPRFGLVYGAGLEDRPHLLAALARGRRLYGNRPEAVRRAKDPHAFFAMLERLRIPHPQIALQPPADPANWLVKRIGASGGSHVGPAAAGGEAAPDRYYQRRLPGRPIGASFLADGRRARLLGFSEQWPWSRGRAPSFRFGGALQPAPIAGSVAAAIPPVLDAIVGETGLVGLNSLDMMVEADRFAVIEVNPRPGANLDIFDGDDAAGLFGLHVQACDGQLPARWQAPARATAMAVVYAERPSHVPATLRWPDWVADRPAPGARMDAGAPVCTVLAAAPDPAAVRRLIDERVEQVLAALAPDGGARPPAPAEAGGTPA